jgi:4-hydroxyphenylpyruvate dioxygenase
MDFNHLQFFVDDLATWRDRFIDEWGANLLKGCSTGSQPQELETTQLISLGQVPILLSAPGKAGDAVDRYLAHHPPGIGNIAFRVNSSLKHLLAKLANRGGTILSDIQSTGNGLQWCRVQGWANLSHTLVHAPGSGLQIPGWSHVTPQLSPQGSLPIDAVDHAVINVPTGQLQEAVAWYVQQFGFCPRQQFTIDTPQSGLHSQVLAHPWGNAQLPINEPATPNSQVQEFLDWNGGTGIQHVALKTRNILKTVGALKARGIEFLNVPASYYQELAGRPGYGLSQATLKAMAQLEILIDWDPQRPQAHLLQTFTQPLLEIPTLFFEIIQRQTHSANGEPREAQGFGERNFQALFEAIEREQAKRGHLQP